MPEQSGGCKWAYGLMTVPSRRHDLLPRTMASLDKGGFPLPHLFIDGEEDTYSWRNQFGHGLSMTFHNPPLRVYGNWVLGMAELYIREPHADRFAMFQDDFVTSLHLKEYLDHLPYPERGYWNLYTFPENQKLCPPSHIGWYPSNQLGKGALGLVFDRTTLLTLLTHQHMVERPLDPLRGWKSVDGGIVTALKKAGWTEYVHNPSLVQHMGLLSTMDKRRRLATDRTRFHPHQWGKHTLATSFQGEDFDLRSLLPS